MTRSFALIVVGLGLIAVDFWPTALSTSDSSSPTGSIGVFGDPTGLGRVTEDEYFESQSFQSLGLPAPLVVPRRNPAPDETKLNPGRDQPPAIDCRPQGTPCFFAGESWNPWFETHHTLVEVSIQVPNHPPTLGDTYYILLSIWDSAQSYDQIGVASTETPGSPPAWRLVYSYTEPCPEGDADYHGSLTLYLVAGQRYTFQMMLLGNGYLTYKALSRGVPIWAKEVPSIASYFKATDVQYCPNYEARGYTNYEEVWALAGNQPVPQWSFYFFDSKLDGSPASSDWGSFYSGSTPSQVVALVNGDDMIISNQYFALSITGGPNFGVYRGTTTFTRQGSVGLIRDPLDCFLHSCVVELSFTQVPQGWTVTVIPSSGMPTFTFTISFSIPSAMPLGIYTVELRATNTPRAQWTDILMRITIKQNPVGGCVAIGTMIRTPSGSSPVQSLQPGSQVLSYDLSTQSFVVSQVLSNSASTESATFIISHFDGSLELTPNHQPIYFKNDTVTGWLENPQDMQIGELIFNPTTSLWVVVTEIAFKNLTTTVYSLIPSAGQGTFMANDILVMRKD